MKSFLAAKVRAGIAIFLTGLPLLALVFFTVWDIYNTGFQSVNSVLLITGFSAFLALFSFSYSSLLSQSRASLEDCRELYRRLEAEVSDKSHWSPFMSSSPDKWRRVRHILETIYKASDLIFDPNHISLFRFYEAHSLELLKQSIPDANSDVRYFTSRSPILVPGSGKAPSERDIAAIYSAVFPEKYSLKEVVQKEGFDDVGLDFLRAKGMITVCNYIEKEVRGHSVDT